MGPMRTLPATATARTSRCKRPEIPFQEESSNEIITEQNEPKRDRGAQVASFYRSLTTPPITEPSSPPSDDILLLDAPPNSEPTILCPVCHLPLPSSPKLQRLHNSTTAHLSKVIDSRPPPVNPLPIDRSSYGYRVLSSQGWNDKQRHGIGAEDNKGRREPVKASRIKNDTVGLGIKGKKIKEADKEKKLIQSGKDIRVKYEKEKKLRKQWMEYMHA